MHTNVDPLPFTLAPNAQKCRTVHLTVLLKVNKSFFVQPVH